LDVCVGGRALEWTARWMGWLDGCVGGWAVGLTVGRMDCVELWIGGLMDVLLDWFVSGRADECMDG
jgi:hypothetical protein